MFKSVSHTFEAPWSTSLRITTGIALAGAFGLAVIGACLLGKPPQITAIALIAAPFLSILVTLPFLIKSYELAEGKLTIHRLFSAPSYDLTRLQSIDADPNAIKGSLRAFGIGGLFSYSGWFWSSRLGKYKMYATDLSKPVVLKFENKTVVVTPRETHRFVQALKA